MEVKANKIKAWEDYQLAARVLREAEKNHRKAFKSRQKAMRAFYNVKGG